MARGQARKAIDAFADVTGDHQWIHVDVERAKDTPFGGTIAHGYYTLSLAPRCSSAAIFALEGLRLRGQLRAQQGPLPGARCPWAPKVRMHAKLSGLEEIPGGAQMTVTVTFEREGERQPVCVAETLARVYAGS